LEILITGGTGLVGRHLVAALQKRGDTVRTLVLPNEDTSWLEERGVAVHRGDIREPDTLKAPMRGVDTVFHLAAMMGVWQPFEVYYKVNVGGTENVCRAALAAQVRRLVHVSSWTTYGNNLGQEVTEDFAPARWNDPYVITKVKGDQLVQRLIAEEKLPATIVRPGTIFGASDRLNFGRTVDRMRVGKNPIIGSGRNLLPLVYITDVVQGLLLCAEKECAVGQAYNITNEPQVTQEEFLRAIAKNLGIATPRLYIPYPMAYALAIAAEQAATVLRSKDPLVTRHGVTLFGTDNRHSIAKARAELGYAPQVKVREGIRLACDWYREHSMPDANVLAQGADAQAQSQEVSAAK